MAAAHKVTKMDDGDFEYRGVEFTRVDRLRGYSDHYRTCRKVKGMSVVAPTRRELLTAIDRILDAASGPSNSDFLAAIGPCGK